MYAPKNPPALAVSSVNKHLTCLNFFSKLPDFFAGNFRYNADAGSRSQGINPYIFYIFYHSLSKIKLLLFFRKRG